LPASSLNRTALQLPVLTQVKVLPESIEIKAVDPDCSGLNDFVLTIVVCVIKKDFLRIYIFVSLSIKLNILFSFSFSSSFSKKT